jgi:Fe-Mn family superoxide dismutase
MWSTMSRRDVLRGAGLGTLALTLHGALGCQASGQPSEGSGSMMPESKYTLPALPYAYNALAPKIDEQTLRIHHDKHHAGYVKGLNSTLEKLEEARAAGDYGWIKALSRDLAFFGSGDVLHSLYWVSMTPRNTQPKGKLLSALGRDFRSLDVFKAQFLAATKAVEGSGWGLLVYEPLGKRLLVLQAEKHQNLTFWGVVPLLACDVWEHAYYLHYQNNRAAYVDNFFTLIDWDALGRRYEQCVD